MGVRSWFRLDEKLDASEKGMWALSAPSELSAVHCPATASGPGFWSLHLGLSAVCVELHSRTCTLHTVPLLPQDGAFPKDGGPARTSMYAQISKSSPCTNKQSLAIDKYWDGKHKGF